MGLVGRTSQILTEFAPPSLHQNKLKASESTPAPQSCDMSFKKHFRIRALMPQPLHAVQLEPPRV